MTSRESIIEPFVILHKQNDPSVQTLVSTGSYSYDDLQDLIHRQKLEKPLEVGEVVKITGGVHEECERFCVNLVCINELVSGLHTTGYQNDIALHVNPRFERQYVVRNHRINNKWGAEETGGSRAFNLQRGATFSIQILVSETCYCIAINEEHYCKFPFKISLKKVNYIEIIGGVVVKTINVEKIHAYPVGFEKQILSLALNTPFKNINALPFTCKLPSVLQMGHEINIQGKVKLLPIAFYINLQSSPFTWPHPKVPLHINARFAQKGGEVYIIRNSWQNDKWGTEQRAITTKFIPGRAFTLTIKCESEGYTIWTNKILVATFLYEMTLDQATYLYIEGDIFVDSIEHRDTITEIYHNKALFDDHF